LFVCLFVSRVTQKLLNRQKAQLSLTNRAMRLEILTFKNTVILKPGLDVSEAYQK